MLVCGNKGFVIAVFLFFSFLRLFLNKRCCCCCFPPGLPEPEMVTICSGAAHPIHRHHAHAAGGHLSGYHKVDGDERLPERAAEPAGQQGGAGAGP